MWHSPKGVIQRKGLTDEKATRMLEGFRAGSTLRPYHLPTAKFKAYCDSHPAYAEIALPLLAANLVASNKRKGALKRNQTHCKAGHPLSGTNLYIEKRTGFRRCMTCILRRNAEPSPPTTEQVERVTAAINAGQRAVQFCGNGSPDRIFGFNKLKILRQNNPEFDRLYTTKILLVRPRSNMVTHREVTLTPAQQEYQRVARLVPYQLPHDIRDDVIQSIFLAILEGSLQLDQVQARVKEFVRAHYREANKHGVGKFGLRSLDAPIKVDSKLTRMDVISLRRWEAGER
ncbi:MULTISPECIES: hypothetical protein [unclassified Bradyrhizobium]